MRKIKNRKKICIIICMVCICCIFIGRIYRNIIFESIEVLKYDQTRARLLFRETEMVDIAIIDSGISNQYKRGCDYCINFTSDFSVFDFTGHGTLMYEIIHSKQFGVAPNAKVSILKVTDNDGNTYISNVIKALQWCRKNCINVVLMSLSTTKNDKRLHKEVKRVYKKGIHIFSAVSNESCFISYPAAYREVIGVYAWRKQKFYDYYDFLFVPLAEYNLGSIVRGNSLATAFCAGIATYYLTTDNEKNKHISNENLKTKICEVIKK